MKLAKIGDFYVLPEASFELIDKLEVGGSDGAVVDMDSDDQ